MDTSALPALNALLNTVCTGFLLAGWRFIRHGRQRAHRAAMISALTTSALFLISYLTYHYTHGSTRFVGEGFIRPVYFIILGTHTVLAAAIVPLVAITLVRALRERFDAHRRIARWTLPIWLYVSVTGVVVYLLLYHFYPSA
jgi:putative membrane protein